MKFYNKNTQGFFGLVAFGVLLYLGVSNISYILKGFSRLLSEDVWHLLSMCQ